MSFVWKTKQATTKKSFHIQKIYLVNLFYKTKRYKKKKITASKFLVHYMWKPINKVSKLINILTQIIIITH